MDRWSGIEYGSRECAERPGRSCVIGKTLGHYRILEKLGSGGMGEVYLAENLRLHKRVALKFLSESVRDDPIASQRLSREARAIAELDHPNIARIYDFQEVDGRQFLVMEYLEGETLADRIRAHGRLESDIRERPDAVPVRHGHRVSSNPPCARHCRTSG